MDDSDYFYTDYEIPDDESVIWRYLDFPKFVSLLKDKALFMTRADKFEDGFEGAVCELKNKQQYDEALSEYYSSIVEGTLSVVHLVEDSHTANELIRKNSFISCWYESPHESMAMWRLYAASNEPKGIAIKSNVGSLRKSIGHDVEIGRIQYIDYSKTWLNPNEALWRKRLSFEYEHEVRIRITPKGGLSKTPPENMMLPVDLNNLIKAVYVSPMADNWFKDVVSDVMMKYDIEKDVFHSQLDSSALF